MGWTVGEEGSGAMGRDEVGGRRKKANARGQEVGVLTWSISFRVPAGDAY